MNIFKRVQSLMVAGAHQAVDLAEDPELMLRQAVRDLDDTIRGARAAVVSAVASEKQLGAQLERHRTNAERLTERARQALAENREDLATTVLRNKVEAERSADEIDQAWNQARTTSASLKQRLDTLVTRRGTLCSKRDALIARQRAARARCVLGRSAVPFDLPESAGERVARMEERVAANEAESLALTELDDEQGGAERELSELETDSRVRAELDALKAQTNPRHA